MAFALTKFKAYVTSIKSATRTRAIQRASMTITAANTDTALDVGTNGGTFWTAVKANATYGAMATQAYNKILEIVSQATVLDEIGGTIEAYDRVDGQKYDYYVFDSVAGSGGAATETMTVTGLAASDTILAVTQKTAGAGKKRVVIPYTSTASTGGNATETVTVTGLLNTDTIVSVNQKTAGAGTKPSHAKLTSTASSGGAATETITVTGLLGTDTVLAITQKTPGANGTAIVGWGAPGAGTINVTWTANPGANAVLEVLVSRTTLVVPVTHAAAGAGTLSVTWEADPGAGAVLEVVVERQISVLPTAIGAVGADSLAVTWEADPGAGAVVKVLARRTATSASSSYSMTVANKRPNIVFVSGGAPTTNYLELQWELADENMGVTIDLGA